MPQVNPGLVEMLAADWVRDDNGWWWLLQVKALGLNKTAATNALTAAANAAAGAAREPLRRGGASPSPKRARRPASATLLRRPLTSNNPDPSRHRGNTRVIELPVRSTDPYFNRVSYANASASLLEEIDTDSRLGHWLRAFSLDEESFASKAVFVEARLRQAVASSEALDTPNAFRAAVVCDAFERVAPLTGRYETVLTLIWRELVRLIYADYSDDLPGSGTRRHFTR